MMAKILWALLAASFVAMSAGKAADLPVFTVKPAEIANIALNVDPGEPWIFSITLTKEKLEGYHTFTVAHRNEEISLVIAGIEIYRPLIRSTVTENPLTFRMYEKDKFMAILAALPGDPR